MKTIKKLGVWAVVVAAILMIPLVTRAPWTWGDFVFAGTVLFGLASIYELITRKMNNKMYRIIVGMTVLAVLMLIWAWAVV